MFEAAIILTLWLSPCLGDGGWVSRFASQTPQATEASSLQSTISDDILAAAKRMVQIGPRYRFEFPEIDYPVGDLAAGYGHCCDVVVRACRAAGIDLQQLVYEDSLRDRPLYIEANRLHNFSRPLNRSWAHRRTANLNLFLQRHALSLPTRFHPDEIADWRPGDIVVYRKGGRLTWHIAIVSDEIDPVRNMPKVIDAWSNPGYVSEKHLLTYHGEIAGHYRFEESFRESLPEEHRAAALLAWEEFLEQSGVSPQRLAESMGPKPGALSR